MKLILTIITVSILYPAIMAQDTISNSQVPEPQQEVQPKKVTEKPAWKNKIYFGGYVNFSLGSYTSIGIEPMVGYKIIPRLSLGVKVRYDYIKDNRYSSSYTASNYGGSLFTRLSVIKQLYLHAEYAGYNYENYDETGSQGREWVPFFFVGAGFRQPLGGRAALNVQILFDVLNSEKSPYRQWAPFYSVGISAGF